MLVSFDGVANKNHVSVSVTETGKRATGIRVISSK